MDDIILPVIRMEMDPILGLSREEVTCTRYELDVYEYCRAKLGSIIAKGAFVQKKIIIPDMNGRISHTSIPGEAPHWAVSVHALIPKVAQGDFTEWASSADAFAYPPYGVGAHSLGFFSRATIGWIVPHRDIPALLFKLSSDENVFAVETFMDVVSSITAQPRWPNVPRAPEVVVPESMSKLRCSPKKQMIRRNRLRRR